MKLIKQHKFVPPDSELKNYLISWAIAGVLVSEKEEFEKKLDRLVNLEKKKIKRKIKGYLYGLESVPFEDEVDEFLSEL